MRIKKPDMLWVFAMMVIIGIAITSFIMLALN